MSPSVESATRIGVLGLRRVHGTCREKLLHDSLSQCSWLEYLGMLAMSQYIHGEFGRVSEGDLQKKGSVRGELRLLLRMAEFSRNPA